MTPMFIAIIAKLRRVTRYVVAVSLAAAFCFSAFADIYCTPGEPWKGSDGQWYVEVTCAGAINSTTIVPIDVVVTNGSGGCENCTAMSPAACESMRSSLSDSASSLSTSLGLLRDSVFGLGMDFQHIIDVLQSVYDESSMNMDVAYDISDYLYMELYSQLGLTSEQFDILVNNGFSGYVTVPAEGVYNPVKSNIPYAIDYLQNIQSSVDEGGWLLQQVDDSLTDVSSLSDYIDGIDCSPCQASGGSGGGDSPSSPSGGCPCSEVLNAIKEILNGFKTKFDDWDKRIKSIQSNLMDIRTSVNALAFMGTNFTYAVQYRTLDGVSFTMKQLDKTMKANASGFDFHEFGNLSWYSRVEYLLLSIAGVFSTTNRTADVTEDKLDDQYDQIANRESSIKTSVEGVGQQFNAVHQSMNNFFMAFKNGIGTGENANIRLFSDWIGDHALEFTINSTVAQGCRACTSLVWSVAFFMLLYEILLYFWKFFASAVWVWVRGTTAFVK